MGIILLTLLLIAALILGWHVFFPLLGGAIVIGGIVWFFLIGSIVAFCLAILLIFVITGAGLIILGSLALIWTLLAVLFFPVLFPILLPLFIILLILAYWRRKRKIP